MHERSFRVDVLDQKYHVTHYGCGSHYLELSITREELFRGLRIVESRTRNPAVQQALEGKNSIRTQCDELFFKNVSTSLDTILQATADFPGSIPITEKERKLLEPEEYQKKRFQDRKRTRKKIIAGTIIGLTSVLTSFAIEYFTAPHPSHELDTATQIALSVSGIGLLTGVIIGDMGIKSEDDESENAMNKIYHNCNVADLFLQLKSFSDAHAPQNNA